MGSARRNVITRTDALWIAGIAVASGIGAALAGCEPTGGAVVDALLCAAFGAVVAWLGASAPWWALLTGSALVLAGAVGGPPAPVAAAAIAAAGSAWIGATQANRAVVRAATAAVVAQVAVRLDFDPVFLASALVAAVAVTVIAVTGARRRQRYVRRRILWTGVGVVVVAVVASAGFAVALFQQRTTTSSGYRTMILGLEYVEVGDAPRARVALDDAADQLTTAGNGLSGLIGQGARLVPGLAQNRSTSSVVLTRAGAAASTAADALAVIDLDRLQVSGGEIDVVALAELADPFEQLRTSLLDLQQALVEADSGWLVAPLQDRIDIWSERSDRLVPQSAALAAAARSGPDMLGASGTRRYLLAFVNGAEARAHSGLMGNWSELTVTDGRMSVTRSGITNELQGVLRDRDVFIDQDPEFFARFGLVGAGDPPEIGVHPNLWANVTSTPDMATVGDVMAQLYEVEAGHPVDGVIVIDPAAVAALLAITGPIEIDELDEPLTADNVERFLVFEQYEIAEGDRKDLLEEVTDATVDRVLNTTLPAPQRMAAILADAVLHGHLSAWATRPDEQELFTLIGMDATLPRLGPSHWRGDALAVVSDNANPNKIDSFLQRDVHYAATFDETTGELTATLRVELTNDAPSDGLDDYVIGNAHGLERGTNRTVLTVMSPHDLVEYRVDGRIQNPPRQTEKGWNAWPLIVRLDPEDGTATVEVTLTGQLDPGGYQLLFRPQPLPNPDRIALDVVNADGRTIVAHDDPVPRRSVFDADGHRAWR